MTNDRPKLVRCDVCRSPRHWGDDCVVCARGEFVLHEFATAGAVSTMVPTTDYARARYAILTADLDEFGPGWRDVSMRYRGRAVAVSGGTTNVRAYDEVQIRALLARSDFRISPAQRDVAERFWLRGESYQRIAAERRCTVSVVRKLLSRVRRTARDAG